MKIFYPILFIALIGLCSCSDIPNKSVFEPLDIKELSAAIKSDKDFGPFYESFRKRVNDMSDVQRATYYDLTYRKYFKYAKYLNDTAYWNPLNEKWKAEWKKEHERYALKIDSVLNYWKGYLEENSLDQYVKIELVEIDKEYYAYIDGIKNVNLGFRMTPLQGAVEQVCFNYGFQMKTHKNNNSFNKHYCCSTSSFSARTVEYWSSDNVDKMLLQGYNITTLLKDYNVFIEVTDVRKDGVDLSKDNMDIPKSVKECLGNESGKPALLESGKEKIIKELINPQYMSESEYCDQKAKEICRKKDELCFGFSELM